MEWNECRPSYPFLRLEQGHSVFDFFYSANHGRRKNIKLQTTNTFLKCTELYNYTYPTDWSCLTPQSAAVLAPVLAVSQHKLQSLSLSLIIFNCPCMFFGLSVLLSLHSTPNFIRWQVRILFTISQIQPVGNLAFFGSICYYITC